MGTNNSTKGILLDVGTNEAEFLLFRLGAELYGINVAKVCQIMLLDRAAVTRLPKAAPEILGATVFRDKTISVIDLRVHLGVPVVQDPGKPSQELLLITEFNQRITGFVVDAVENIERCTWEQFEPTAETLYTTTLECVVGTVRLKASIVIILDLETITASLDPTMSVNYYEDQIPVGSIDRAQVSIVYCEDSAIVQKTLVKTLHNAGFSKIHTFLTGVEGLAYLEQTPPPQVDVILSDIEMPQMDGLTFCKQVRALPLYQNIPFVFFSSMINEQMQRKCERVGGNAAYSKPQIHLIVEAIEKLIQGLKS